MPAGTLELRWEGAAGRSQDRELLLRVRRLAPERGGLFGLFRSPSVEGWLPDPHVLEAEVAEGPSRGAAVRLRLPGGVAQGLAGVPFLLARIVNPDICIGLEPAAEPGR